MPTKVFTLLGGDCPFGRGIAIDSNGCIKCQHYYRAGTGTFFWCNHPIKQEQAKNEQKRTKKERTPKKGHFQARKDTQKEKWISCTKTGRNARKSKIWQK